MNASLQLFPEGGSGTLFFTLTFGAIPVGTSGTYETVLPRNRRFAFTSAVILRDTSGRPAVQPTVTVEEIHPDDSLCQPIVGTVQLADGFDMVQAPIAAVEAGWEGDRVRVTVEATEEEGVGGTLGVVISGFAV